jgi:hypothetical protein
MKTAIAQDDVRQELIAKHCGLINSTKRYGADAFDENNVEFEIKSGTTKNYISTARDFGFNILQEYRRKYWIIASGILNADKTYLMEELYIAHPDNLSFFLDKVEDILQENKRVVESIKKSDLSISNEDREIMNKIFSRGMTLNDPRINMKYVRMYCTPLDHRNSKKATSQVKRFIANNPIVTTKSAETFNHEFFSW